MPDSERGHRAALSQRFLVINAAREPGWNRDAHASEQPDSADWLAASKLLAGRVDNFPDRIECHDERAEVLSGEFRPPDKRQLQHLMQARTELGQATQLLVLDSQQSLSLAMQERGQPQLPTGRGIEAPGDLG
jgi:hypothetical protein